MIQEGGGGRSEEGGGRRREGGGREEGGREGGGTPTWSENKYTLIHCSRNLGGTTLCLLKRTLRSWTRVFPGKMNSGTTSLSGPPLGCTSINLSSPTHWGWWTASGDTIIADFFGALVWILLRKFLSSPSE
jgi:hypothetical protein